MSQIPEVFQQGWKPPVQSQERLPGHQKLINPRPIDDITADGKPYKASGKLEGKSAIITGADSGIGRAVATLFALEGADLTLTYTPHEEEDARDVEKAIHEKTKNTRKVILLSFDLRDEKNCQSLIREHLKAHGNKLDTLVLNHADQMMNTDIVSLPTEQWNEVFQTNINSFFYITKAAVPHIPRGGTICFTTSVNAFKGNPKFLDYSATKGAIVAFAKSLSSQIVGEKGIRVNAVAPGPIWTPLIPPSMTDDAKEKFGQSVPMGRPGQPVECATCYVFLASTDSSYISGQVLHPNGGNIVV
ncbi:NAD-binding protein [Rickenella mellea]|uniref:NAD-binding protein n=1 Tax=Rickenella mellea TaxID=50990 RepID=A0A4Y7PVK1_9AGAM|nr:NAD-binding protein [Rickenella mellea]